MKDKTTFEEFLTQKLDSIQPEYQSEYWEKYQMQYPHKKNRRGVLFTWMPYLFSILLFLLGWFASQHKYSNTQIASSHAQPDTIVVYHEVHSIDTIVVRDTVYISHVEYSSTRSPFSISAKNHRNETNQDTINISRTTPPVEGPNYSSIHDQSNLLSQLNTEATLSEKNTTQNNDLKSKNQTPTAVYTVAASTFLPQSEKTSNTEVAIESKPIETTNLSTEKEKRDLNISFFAGTGVSIFRNAKRDYIESSVGLFSGIDAGIKLERFSLGIGIYYGGLHHEIDDVELTPSQLLLSLPGNSLVVSNLDDIKIRSTNAFLPITLSYHFWEKDRLSASFNAGITSNIVLKEKFKYILDIPEDMELTYVSTKRSMSFSHASIGLGLNYELNEKWHLGIRANYFHALNPSGSFTFSNPMINSDLKLIRYF